MESFFGKKNLFFYIFYSIFTQSFDYQCAADRNLVFRIN